MFYIIGGIILFLIFARFGSGGIGCFFLLVISGTLWKIGVLPYIIRIMFKVGQWILVRTIYYINKFIGEDPSAGFILNKIGILLFN